MLAYKQPVRRECTSPHQNLLSEISQPELLLVDDNAIQASTRSAILGRAGIRVAVAQRPEEAVRLVDLAEVRSSLQIVVTDHLMPEMNGPELVERLRVMLPDIPVLVLSGLPDAEPEYQHLNVAFHLKPFPPEELIRVVKALMANRVRRTA